MENIWCIPLPCMWLRKTKHGVGKDEDHCSQLFQTLSPARHSRVGCLAKENCYCSFTFETRGRARREGSCAWAGKGTWVISCQLRHLCGSAHLSLGCLWGWWVLAIEKVEFVVRPRKTNVNQLKSALLSALPSCRGFDGDWWAPDEEWEQMVPTLFARR